MASIHVLWKVCLLITPPIKSAQMEIGGTTAWIPSFCGSALESSGTGMHWRYLALDALAVQRYLAEHSDTLSPLNPPRHTLAPVCASPSASCCYNLTGTHTCKVQGGFYVASMQCWASYMYCGLEHTSCVPLHTWKCHSGGLTLTQISRLVIKLLTKTCWHVLKSGWKDFDDISLHKYGQLINDHTVIVMFNGCAKGGLQKCNKCGCIVLKVWPLQWSFFLVFIL